MSNYISKQINVRAIQWGPDAQAYRIVKEKGEDVQVDIVARLSNGTGVMRTSRGPINIQPGEWIVENECGEMHVYSQVEFEKMFILKEI